MIQIGKYVVVFFLGCLFIAHNPDLNVKVISISNMLKDKVVSITGKAERVEEEKKKIQDYRLKQENKKAAEATKEE
jgi:hypothetical protein